MSGLRKRRRRALTTSPCHSSSVTMGDPRPSPVRTRDDWAARPCGGPVVPGQLSLSAPTKGTFRAMACHRAWPGLISLHHASSGRAAGVPRPAGLPAGGGLLVLVLARPAAGRITGRERLARGLVVVRHLFRGISHPHPRSLVGGSFSGAPQPSAHAQEWCRGRQAEARGPGRPAGHLPRQAGPRQDARADGASRVAPPRRRPAALRHSGASRPQPPLGPAPRARRRHGVVGAAQGPPRRPGAQPPGRAHRGPPDGVQRVRGRHPSGRIRGGLRVHLGPGPLRRREVVGLRGEVRPARRPGVGRLRAVPDQGPGLDDPPPRAGDHHRPRADVHCADAGHPGSPARRTRRGVGLRGQVGRRPGHRLRRGRPGRLAQPQRQGRHGDVSRPGPHGGAPRDVGRDPGWRNRGPR